MEAEASCFIHWDTLCALNTGQNAEQTWLQISQTCSSPPLSLHAVFLWFFFSAFFFFLIFCVHFEIFFQLFESKQKNWINLLMFPFSWPDDNYMITLSIRFFIQEKKKGGGERKAKEGKKEPLSASIALFTALLTSYSENISFLSFHWRPLIFFSGKHKGHSFCLACGLHWCGAFQGWKVLLWLFCRIKTRTMAVGQWVGSMQRLSERDAGCLGHLHKPGDLHGKDP